VSFVGCGDDASFIRTARDCKRVVPGMRVSHRRLRRFHLAEQPLQAGEMLLIVAA
jgi:hypothetical protein